MSARQPKVLTEELLLKKSKAKTLDEIKNINLWGQQLGDISIIKKVPHLETCALSVNEITSLEPFSESKSLTELFLRNNKIDGLDQLFHLKGLPNLSVLWLSGNPIENADDYRLYTIALLPNLKKLDQIDITDDEKKAAKEKYPNPHPPRGPKKPNSEQVAAYNAIHALLPALSKESLNALLAKL